MSNLDNPYPRFWRVKRFFRKGIHDFKRFARIVAENRFCALVIPWVTGSYYLMLDIWGDKWAWIQNSIEFHEKSFVVCLGLSLGMLFLKGLLKNRSGRFEDDGVACQVLGEFIKTAGIIVQHKIRRFRTKLPNIKKNSDKFSHITHPKEQLGVIAHAMTQFLQKSYNFKEDQISITIIGRKDSSAWQYVFQNQEWTHTVAQNLMTETSAAKYCLETGEDLFLSDKIKAAKDGRYHLTKRDKRRGDGSAYVYPVQFNTTSLKMDYIVSVVTYGGQLCHEYEKQTADITKAFLRELVRRFEVELCLLTIKTRV